MNKEMGKIVNFERYSSFDSINRVYLDGRFSSVNLIINVHDPEKQITNLNQILNKMLIWRTQDGIILMKDYILDQPISEKIPIPLYQTNITLEIEFKQKPYDTAEILDVYLLID
jgi:hypothetical protein